MPTNIFNIDTEISGKLTVSGTSDFIISSTGNVGIGTTSPSYKLDVSGSSASVANLYSTGYTNLDIVSTRTSGNIGGVRFKQSADTYISTEINAVVDGGLEIKTGNGSTAPVTHFKLDASGNVGIGTTSPGRKLHVVSNGAIAEFKSTDTGTSGFAEVHYENDAGHQLIVGSVGSGYTNIAWAGARYMYATAGDLMIKTLGSGTNLRFYTAGATNERMRIDGSGNVGIGTTSPNASLHIEKAGDQASSVKGITLSSDAAGTNKYLPAIVWSYGASGTPDFAKLEVQRSGGTGGRMLFSVANSSGTMSEAIRIDESGNVGIGTTIPSEKLHVVGRVHIGDVNYSYGGSNYHIKLAENSNDAYISNIEGYGILSAGGYYHGANLRMLNSTSTAYSAIQMRPDGTMHFESATGGTAGTTIGASTKMYISGAGNVGIGTTSPTQKLDVAGNINIPNNASLLVDGVLAFTQDSASGFTSIGVGGGLSVNPIQFTMTFNGADVLFGSLSSGAIPAKATFGVSDSGIVSDFPPSEALRINSSGDVGIGITNPSEKLHVDGNILASGDITAFSDARIKENVETLPNALESIKAMRGVTYNKIGEEKQSIGVIAQEVQAVLPQLVSEHNDGMLSVAYGNVTAVLIEAIKEQQKQIEELKAQLDGLAK